MDGNHRGSKGLSGKVLPFVFVVVAVFCCCCVCVEAHQYDVCMVDVG